MDLEYGGSIDVGSGDIGNIAPPPPVDEFGLVINELWNFVQHLKFSIDIQDIILILASVVGVGMLFFLAWLGVRKATRTFTTAVSTGKIKI